MEEAGIVIGKNTTLDVPPPGLGLTTVTEAVPAVAMSELKMLAANCELLTNVVARALPFQFTTDPNTKPVPSTVRENPALPGATASGTSGWLISGTGFTVPVGGVYSCALAKRMPAEQRVKPTKTRGLKKADREVEFVFMVSFCSNRKKRPELQKVRSTKKCRRACRR